MPGTITQATRRECQQDATCQEILYFLAKHPFTKFNRMALAGLFKSEERWRVDPALKKLLAQELIAYQYNGNLYWLTPEEPTHSLLRARFGSRSTEPAVRIAFFQGELKENAPV